MIRRAESGQGDGAGALIGDPFCDCAAETADETMLFEGRPMGKRGGKRGKELPVERLYRMHRDHLGVESLRR